MARTERVTRRKGKAPGRHKIAMVLLAALALVATSRSETQSGGQSQLREPTHVAKLFPPSFSELMAQRFPFGRCWMTCTLCFNHGQFNARLVDDSEWAYTDLNVGQDEDACLRRAKDYFEWCGNLPLYPVAMIFAPTSATDSYPSTEAVEEANKIEAAQAIDKTDYGGYFLSEVWYSGGHAPLDSVANAHGRIPAAEEGGWKTISVFVERSFFGQRRAWNGQYQQDQWVMQLLDGKEGGFFVDLAAYDAVQWSNTLTLERDFGWDGLCIEANSDRMWGLSHRRCRVLQALVGSDSGDQLPFTSIGKCGPGCAGIVGAGADNKESYGRTAQMPTVSMRRVLREFGAPAVVDYLSLDVEGAEDLVLSSFPFETHSVLLMTVERPSEYAVGLLRAQGYSFVRSLPPWNPLADDELWAHTSLPGLRSMLDTYAAPEPEVRLHWINSK